MPMALLAALCMIGALVAGEYALAAVILLGLAVLAVALLLLAGMVAWVSRWHVDPNGIGGRNNWLVYHRLDWPELESVQSYPIPVYRYVQVNGAGKRWVFWLPLFLTDMPGFRSAVARYAPPENPLRRYLEQHPA